MGTAWMTWSRPGAGMETARATRPVLIQTAMVSSMAWRIAAGTEPGTSVTKPTRPAPTRTVMGLRTVSRTRTRTERYRPARPTRARPTVMVTGCAMATSDRYLAPTPRRPIRMATGSSTDWSSVFSATPTRALHPIPSARTRTGMGLTTGPRMPIGTEHATTMRLTRGSRIRTATGSPTA